MNKKPGWILWACFAVESIVLAVLFCQLIVARNALAQIQPDNAWASRYYDTQKKAIVDSMNELSYPTGDVWVDTYMKQQRENTFKWAVINELSRQNLRRAYESGSDDE